MSVFFTGDPHLGHKNIATFRTFIKNTVENTAYFVEQWHKHINKRSMVFMLGDVAFDNESLDIIGNLPGRKILIKGNHDDFLLTSRQATVFEEIHGMLSYKRMWLTHCPIHPHEMRKRKANLHGHVHHATVHKGWGPFRRPDPRYINSCVDVLVPKYGRPFITLDEVKARL